MKIEKLLLRTGWNLEKIKYFLSGKIYNDDHSLKEELNWPNSFINKIESSPQFQLFDDLTYEQMKDYQNSCDIAFSQNTLDTVTLIENIPHNFILPSEDFAKDDCLIMVDASLKKYGDEEYAGIAGCIRNADGNVVMGFTQNLKRDLIDKRDDDTSFHTGQLEFAAIREGAKIANELGLKRYTIASDCIGNVTVIHKAMNGIPPLSSDYFLNKDKFDLLLEQLATDQAKVVYIPRVYNNVADEFSKSYQRRMGDLFRSNSEDIKNESVRVLENKSIYNSNHPVFFYQHNQYTHNSQHNPYEMTKNVHLDHLIDAQTQTLYDQYLFTVVYITSGKKSKSIFHFLVNPADHTFKFHSVDKEFDPSDAMNAIVLKSIAKVIKESEFKNVGLLCSIGTNAILNRIIPIASKDISSYQELYKSLSPLKNWGAFLRSETLTKKINLWIADSMRIEHVENHPPRIRFK